MPELLAPLRLGIRVVESRFRLRHRGLGDIDRDPVIGRVDLHQQIALVHHLIIDDGQLRDIAGDLRGDGHHVDAHAPVASPRRAHVGLPHGPGERARDRDHDQRGEKRQYAKTPPAPWHGRRGGRGLCGRRHGRGEGSFASPTGFGSPLDRGHQQLRFAAVDSRLSALSYRRQA